MSEYWTGERAGRALIVERQAFFVPFLREALERAGHQTIVVSRSVSPLTLQRVRPHTVVIGVHGLGPRPLETIRLTRRQRPSARIVAIVLRDDPAWSALARSLGADSVLGPTADHGTLTIALSRQATLARQAPCNKGPNFPETSGASFPAGDGPFG